MRRCWHKFYDGTMAQRKKDFKTANGNMKTNPLEPNSIICYKP